MTDREQPRMPKAMNEPHLACLLLLDTSGSMSGEPIAKLNEAVNGFKEKTCVDDLTKKRVDVAIVQFDDTVETVQEFTPIVDMQPVNLNTGGCTYMCAAIDKAIDMVKERNRLYDSMGTPCFKPWVFMITDGMPSDESRLQEVAARIKTESDKGKLKFFALGTDGYDKDVLCTLTDKCIELKDHDFTKIFNWMSESMKCISVSKPGEAVQLPVLPENAQRIVPNSWGN